MKVISESFLETDLTEKQQFQVKVSPKTFSVLTKDIYKNPKLAICRELACNAWDSHLVAGTQDVPFEVYFPTITAPDFIVKDYGTGLSVDAVMNLYTTYFGSDKDHSNELTGGFGLGSKTPFSFTDQFAVESRFQGKKYKFSAFLEDGVPTIAHIRTEDSTEPNGLTVIVPAQAGVFDDTVTCLRWFPLIPKIIGCTQQLEQIDWDYRTNEFGIYKKNGNDDDAYYGNAVYCLMGNVRYETDIRAFNYTSYRMVLFAAIGSYDIQVSREALNIDSETVLQPRINDHKKEYKTVIINRIKAKATSNFERLKLFYAFQEGLLKEEDWPDLQKYGEYFSFAAQSRAGNPCWQKDEDTYSNYGRTKLIEKLAEDDDMMVMMAIPKSKYIAIAKEHFANTKLIFAREKENDDGVTDAWLDWFDADRLIDPRKYSLTSKVKNPAPGTAITATKYAGQQYGDIYLKNDEISYVKAKAMKTCPVKFYGRRDYRRNDAISEAMIDYKADVLFVPNTALLTERFKDNPSYLTAAVALFKKKCPELFFYDYRQQTRRNRPFAKEWNETNPLTLYKENDKCVKLEKLFRHREFCGALQAELRSALGNSTRINDMVPTVVKLGWRKEHKLYKRILAQYPAIKYMLTGRTDTENIHQYMRDQDELHTYRKVPNTTQ